MITQGLLENELMVSKDASSITMEMPSDRSLTTQAINACCNFLTERGITLITRFSVVLKELLDNAILHGNKNDKNLRVKCNLTDLENGCFSMSVEDEGEGFDYHDINTQLPSVSGGDAEALVPILGVDAGVCDDRRY